MAERNPLTDIDWRKVGMPAGGGPLNDPNWRPGPPLAGNPAPALVQTDPHVLMNRLKELTVAREQARRDLLEYLEEACRKAEGELQEYRQMRELLGRGPG